MEKRKLAYQTCFQILANIEASRAYVRNTLRPTILQIAQKNTFIPEAMSASFVARTQFEHFLKEYPDYHVKFASFNPRNPINKADNIESDILNQFINNPGLNEWHGITEKNEVEYFTVAKPFRFKKGCMKCHGDPDSAPKEIVSRYGDSNGFQSKVGDVTMYSISSPIRVTYQEIWNHTFALFLPLVVLITFTLFVSSYLLSRTVSKPIEDLTTGINKLGEEDYQAQVDFQKAGELKKLAIAFNEMAKKLNESQINRQKAENELREAHEALEERVKERTSELITANEELKEQIKQREGRIRNKNFNRLAANMLSLQKDTG